MNTIDWIARVLVIIGALNWGLAVFNTNLVSALLGTSIIATIVYALVGLAGIWEIVRLFQK
jgi:uncharacterized membrane protein YuzA (DUF378 family)